MYLFMNRGPARQVTGGLIHMLRELESSCLLSWDCWKKEESSPSVIKRPLQGSLLGQLGLLYVVDS